MYFTNANVWHWRLSLFILVCTQGELSTKSLMLMYTVGMASRAGKGRAAVVPECEGGKQALKWRLCQHKPWESRHFQSFHTVWQTVQSSVLGWVWHITHVSQGAPLHPFRLCAFGSLWLIRIVNKCRLVWAMLKRLCCLNWHASCCFI